MSLVANQPTSQTQTLSQSESEPKANGHLYDRLIHGKSGKSGNANGSTILKDMLASASQMAFSEPVGKNAFAIGGGVREIAPGPRSPKGKGNGTPNGHASLPRVNGHASREDEEEEDDEPDSPSPSKAKAGPSKIIGPVMPTSTRKGKEPASNPKERVLYEDPIDLTWPLAMRTRKSSAAGLYNPSMACYANATLQVLLHTPPVLRIAASHDSKNCKLAHLSHDQANK